MIKGILLTLALIVSVIAGAVIFTPLEYVLKQAGLERTGAGWANVEGNILEGRISGFYLQNQPVGDVRLKLKPRSLLSGQAAYEISWSGAGGRGSGLAAISSKAITLSNIRGQHMVQAIEGLAPQVRAIGGEIRLADGSATLTRQGCEDAGGTLSTDTLSRAATQYGKTFGDLSGPVSCLEGAFVVNLEGRAQNGDRVTIAASASPLGQSSFAATVTTNDSDLLFVLPRIGFVRSGNDWQYINNSDGRGAP